MKFPLNNKVSCAQPVQCSGVAFSIYETLMETGGFLQWMFIGKFCSAI